jgi:hypothetical protein
MSVVRFPPAAKRWLVLNFPQTLWAEGEALLLGIVLRCGRLSGAVGRVKVGAILCVNRVTADDIVGGPG